MQAIQMLDVPVFAAAPYRGSNSKRVRVAPSVSPCPATTETRGGEIRSYPLNPARERLEAFLAHIHAVVFENAVLHGIRGSTIDFEIDLWNRLNDAIVDLAGEYERSKFGSDHWIAALALAAYEVVLDYGFDRPFLDLQLSLWYAIKKTVRRKRPFLAA